MSDETQESLGMPCEVCKVPRVTHEQAERAGTINHAWSADGLVEATTLRGAQSAGKRRVAGGGDTFMHVMVAPAPDMMLRRLLVQLGVVTQEQIDALEMPVTALRVPQQADKAAVAGYEALDKDL